jgi:hypothetical protein
MTSNPARVQEPIAARHVRNTAELSGELSVGDVVAVGEVPLAVASVGWTLVRGGLNEVRTDEHGTRPLPASAAPGEPPPASTAKEYRDECP